MVGALLRKINPQHEECIDNQAPDATKRTMTLFTLRVFSTAWPDCGFMVGAARPGADALHVVLPLPDPH